MYLYDVRVKRNYSGGGAVVWQPLRKMRGKSFGNKIVPTLSKYTMTSQKNYSINKKQTSESLKSEQQYLGIFESKSGYLFALCMAPLTLFCESEE